MKCRSCGTELDESWSFCPRCGVKKGHEFSKGVEDVMELFERSIKGVFSGGFPMNFPFGKGFMVEISQEGGTPRVSVKEFGDAPSTKDTQTEGVEKAKKIPKDSTVVEPEVMAKGEKVLVVRLPGVESEDDVHIKKFHDSIEIRAFGDKKVYFAILPNIKSPKVEHKFNNEVLTLKLS